MEKTARRPSADPAQERLRQNKSVWNKEVSSFINDLIHFKKMMNGWPSKFFKERVRITQPIPADPATIIGSLAGDFQEIASKGNTIIQEQIEYSKTRRQKQPKPTPGPQPVGAPAAPEAPKPVAPDLSQQMGKNLAASYQAEIIKLASSFEDKYLLESEASNPFSRFITKLFNPKFGFGEGARIRRLRMALLDNCVKSYKELKKLHKEIVKSSKGSITTSYKMMTQVSNYWSAVNRLMSTYNAIRPDAVVKDEGGQIETDPELKKEKAIEEGRDPDEPIATPSQSSFTENLPAIEKMRDFLATSAYLGTVIQSPLFRELHSVIESIMAAPKDKKFDVLQKSDVSQLYNRLLQEVNIEMGTHGNSLAEAVQQKKSTPIEDKTAQRQLGKIRHQVLPGATSGQRLEIYRFITQIKRDMDEVMNLLEKGFDPELLSKSVAQVTREIAMLRLMVRSLHAAENPNEVQTSFF